MRILLEIPDSDIPKTQEIIEIPIHFIDGTVCEAGGFGFDIIPKGCGRLIDAEFAVEVLNSRANRDYRRITGSIVDAIKIIQNDNYTPTIIEADKEEKNEVSN